MSNILLVEASETDCRLFQQGLLAFDGVSAQIVRSPTWALHEMRRHADNPGPHSPRLILLGMGSPPDAEFVLLRALKTDPLVKRLPLLAFAPRDGHRWIAPAVCALANCALVKPHDSEAFVSLVTTALRLWLRQAQLPRMNGVHCVQPAFATGGVCGGPPAPAAEVPEAPAAPPGT